KDYLKDVEGSVLIELGETRLVCSATLQEGVPPFLKGSRQGWVTAEYGMLPRSTPQRIPRWRDSGRTHEIQRLIGRSLRSVADLSQLKDHTIIVDCDVIQADGGTRTTAITGGFVAFYEAVQKMSVQGMLESFPISHFVAAVSCGIVDDDMLLDLNYEEDSGASADMNVVMTDDGKIVEIQCTAERQTFTLDEMEQLIRMAKKGIEQLIEAQRGCVSIRLV
ncbi:MAG: ribonuclease PH, partial [bacterium]